MTSQGGREEHSPVKSPHFFKIIPPDSLRDGKLRIPTRFIRRYGESLSNLALIKLPNGAEWKLELAKCDGKVWLKKGWREFMEYSSLKQGHLLVFRYEGKSHFCVLLFDESATEIDYPFNSSPGEDLKIHEKFPVSRMEEMESDISVERLDDFPAYPKTREKSPLSCPRPRKMMRTNSSAQIRSTANLSRLVPHSTKNKLKEANLKKSKGQAKFHSTMQEFEGVEGIYTTKKPPKSEVLRRIPKMTTDEKAKDLQKARGVKPENPHFDVVMQASYVRFGRVSIPSGFAKRHLNKKCDDIILRLSDGRRWSVGFNFNRRAACQFGGGWKEFVQDNNLVVGDVCSFELIKGIKLSFQVVIFRATEEHCPKLPESESDSSLEILDDFPAYPKMSEKSPLSCPQPHKMKRMNPSAKTGNTLSRLVPHCTQNQCKEAKLEKFKGQANLHSTKQDCEEGISAADRCPESKVPRRTQTINEKSSALQKASGFKPENPYFLVVMLPSYLRCALKSAGLSSFLNIKSGQIVMLQVEEKSWPVKFNSYPHWSYAVLSAGWRTFVADNSLQVGDVCVFELIKSDDVMLKVSIFRCPSNPFGG
ncbi:B3 domain-containing transcription factor VRN1-like isoform X2 [Carya illinoinensis]|uniref:B3 domain-containing transcription factor VRN1-like isoform X2 n=1 Tax=Carya illinoinensis TaxID=32201 RepID=UPI001C720F86|nr:B3 domain-containing transcription factor VRN1-like isoform X2 [Carya illinoinensis]